MASFRISQQNNEEALILLRKSYSIWSLIEGEDIDAPSLTMMIQSAKLFIELETFDESINILETILETDDENSEVWFLLAFCYSHFDVLSANQCLQTCKDLIQKTNVQDPEIHKQINDLFINLNKN